MNNGAISRRDAMLTATASLCVASGRAAATDAGATEVSQPLSYAAPGVLAHLQFGTRSHWLQPWRGGETVPASAVTRGIGAVFEAIALPANPPAIATLAASGVRTVRIEIGWGNVDFETEGSFRNGQNIQQVLSTCRHRDIRPLILLNAHQARPVPARLSEVLVVEAAAAGDRLVRVSSADGILLNRTGINDSSGDRMADILVTHVDGTLLHLSKPLPVALPAGQRLDLATLRYEPFSKPGTPRNEATLAGWLKYVDLVAVHVASILDSSKPDDRGFDLEIWNELTFGSDFLSIANYYDPLPTTRADPIQAPSGTKLPGEPGHML